MIEASSYNAGTAYVSVQRHKMDDFAPYAFKTTDFGKTWTSITNGIPADAFIHAVREDKKRKGLLYAGTERGVFFSWDDGATWQSIQGNLPVSPVYDLTVHGNDLLAATHGRAFWALDDLSPLQQYKPEVANEEVHLYSPSAANHTTFGGGFFRRRRRPGAEPSQWSSNLLFAENSIEKAGREEAGRKES
jgi:hypothetical protein